MGGKHQQWPSIQLSFRWPQSIEDSDVRMCSRKMSISYWDHYDKHGQGIALILGEPLHVWIEGNDLIKKGLAIQHFELLTLDLRSAGASQPYRDHTELNLSKTSSKKHSTSNEPAVFNMMIIQNGNSYHVFPWCHFFIGVNFQTHQVLNNSPKDTWQTQWH